MKTRKHSPVTESHYPFAIDSIKVAAHHPTAAIDTSANDARTIILKGNAPRVSGSIHTILRQRIRAIAAISTHCLASQNPFVPPDRIKGEGREEIKTESESNAQHNTQSNNSCLAPLLDSCPSISTFSPNTDLPPRLAADPLWYPNTLQCKTYNPTYYFPETMCGHYRYTQDLLNLDMHSRNTSRLHHVS